MCEPISQDAMIQECARSGCLKRKNISGLAVMDSSRLDKVSLELSSIEGEKENKKGWGRVDEGMEGG